MRKVLRTIAIILVLAVFFFCAYKLTVYVLQGVQESNALDQLAQMMNEATVTAAPTEEATPLPTQAPTAIPSDSPATVIPAETIAPTPTPEPTEIPAPTMLPQLAVLYEQNPDIYGWLKLEDSRIDYPVMFTPEDPEYYLNRAFDGSDSVSGMLFLDGSCFEDCGNYLIHGHNMKNDSMFGRLTDYETQEYWENHKIISFDTLYEEADYEVLAAFRARVLKKSEDGFRYYRYTDLTEQERFDDYLAQIENVQLYDTGVEAEFGDQLITLSTCAYHTANGRFVVVARKITE